MADTWTKVDAEVALEIAGHEALIRQMYYDSVGVATWCVGMTSATGHVVERYRNKPASVQHCMRLYVWALGNYAKRVRDVFAGVVLAKHQFAAALSFDWNTGAIKKASWVKHFIAGDIDKAREAFMDWDKPPEIIARRKKERDLFFDGKWSNDGTMVEYGVTAKLTPAWKTAKRINVSEELEQAMGEQMGVHVDKPPQPDNVPPAPTTTPSASPGPKPTVVQPKASSGTIPTIIVIALIALAIGAAIFGGGS